MTKNNALLSVLPMASRKGLPVAPLVKPLKIEPPPFEHLSPKAREIFDYLVGQCQADVHRAVDALQLCELAKTMAEMQDCEKYAAKTVTVEMSNGSKRVKTHPKAALYDRLSRRTRRLMTDLGLTPAERRRQRARATGTANAPSRWMPPE